MAPFASLWAQSGCLVATSNIVTWPGGSCDQVPTASSLPSGEKVATRASGRAVWSSLADDSPQEEKERARTTGRARVGKVNMTIMVLSGEKAGRRRASAGRAKRSRGPDNPGGSGLEFLAPLPSRP